MSLLDLLYDKESWDGFYEYKTSLCCPKDFSVYLSEFIKDKSYLPVCGAMFAGEPFPLPKKTVISKMSSQKKRTVYTYPIKENTVLKLLTYLMLRKYDGLFSSGLYSFRPGKTAKEAVRKLTRIRGITEMYSYKVDIHDYFNSVPVNRFLPLLKDALSDDTRLYAFLSSLLSEPRVLDHGEEITEEKGIMAGTPLSAFYANLYLKDLDRHFEEAGVPYARYSDDIIIFGKTEQETKEHARFIKSYLCSAGLTVNPDKECFCSPSDGFTFLGFYCCKNEIDIAAATVKKLKGKMRRKTHALMRWRKRNGLSGDKAAAAFIRIFNRKLLQSGDDNELTWSFWFFSVINTTKSLHQIDLYAQDCIRFLISGKRTKSRYNVRYKDMKALGYRSLVHEYYAFAEAGDKSEQSV